MPIRLSGFLELQAPSRSVANKAARVDLVGMLMA
jgi:hypothetical protein